MPRVILLLLVVTLLTGAAVGMMEPSSISLDNWPGATCNATSYALNSTWLEEEECNSTVTHHFCYNQSCSCYSHETMFDGIKDELEEGIGKKNVDKLLEFLREHEDKVELETSLDAGKCRGKRGMLCPRKKPFTLPLISPPEPYDNDAVVDLNLLIGEFECMKGLECVQLSAEWEKQGVGVCRGTMVTVTLSTTLLAAALLSCLHPSFRLL